jgi:hypothetical protein
MIAHVEGPWGVLPMGRTLAVTYTGGAKKHRYEGVHIAIVHLSPEPSQWDGLHAANARLIAASPELYEALSHLVALLEPMEQNGSLNVPGLATLNGARAALSKVKG